MATELYDICASHSDVLPPDAKLAVVYSSEVFSSSDARFAEDVGVNRGVNMCVFPDSAAAKAWLQEKTEL